MLHHCTPLSTLPSVTMLNKSLLSILQIFFFNIFTFMYLLYVCLHVCVCVCVSQWRLAENLQESFVSSHSMGSKDHTWVLKVGSKWSDLLWCFKWYPLPQAHAFEHLVPSWSQSPCCSKLAVAKQWLNRHLFCTKLCVFSAS